MSVVKPTEPEFHLDVASILAQILRLTYNARAISSHVTGEKAGPVSAYKWASTGEREISI